MNLQENMMSNKDLVLKLINIQYYLMRYGRTHTNWHETLNEVIVRLYDDGRKVFPRLENASNAELIQTLKDIRDYMHFDKDSLHRPWHTVLNTAIMRLKGVKAPANVSESVLHMLLNGVSVRDVLSKKGADIQDTISNISITEKPQMYMKQRTIEVVLPNEEPFFITLSVPGNIKNPNGFIHNWVKTHLPAAADWDYNESKTSSGINLSEAKKVDTKKLEKELTKALYDYMESQGFEPNEAKELSGVEVKSEDDRIVVTAWAEVSYDGLMGLSERLDPVIAKYDKYAYFEPETSGRLVGYIDLSGISESKENYNLYSYDNIVVSTADGKWYADYVDDKESFLLTHENCDTKQQAYKLAKHEIDKLNAGN